MNPKREKKDTAALLKLRQMKAQIAAIKKAACLRQQKAAFEELRQAEKHAEDCEIARNNQASAGMRAICNKTAVNRSALEHEYANFSWATEQLKELRQIIVDKTDAHTKRLEETNKARKEHLYCENKSHQAAQLYQKAKKAHLQTLLTAESEENEEIATTRHILKSAKS
ncbi:MAG: hypothetical protein C5B47_05615 [Verrucomicrobia bacterium]|nr:MAG: hypothetical protein C5B47_05615 [Verrucomicrobiota bacterium]